MTDQQKINLIFKALEESKTTIVAFSKATRISRITLHRWKKGANVNDHLRLDIAYAEAKRLLEGKLLESSAWQR